jgi:hypothetical protein
VTKKYNEYMWWGTNTGIVKLFFTVPTDVLLAEFKNDPMKYYSDCKSFTVEDPEVDRDREPEELE